MPDNTVTTYPAGSPTERARLTATLHVKPWMVSSHDLPATGRAAVVLGDEHANVELVGEIGTLLDVISEAVAQLAAIHRARPQ